MEEVLDKKRPLNTLTIREMHAKMMYTARFLDDGTYVAAGELRSVTQQSVVVGATGPRPIQCCPYERIDQELDYICRALQVRRMTVFRNGSGADLIAMQDHLSREHNPFAIASWLHLVFVRCHPFEARTFS